MAEQPKEKPFIPKQCLPWSANLLREMVGTTAEDGTRYWLAECIPPIQPGAVIHDNGCGFGTVTKAVLGRYPELLQSNTHAPEAPGATTIHATDISKGFVESLQEFCTGNGWSNIVKTSAMPAEKLSFEDGTFSHSFTNFLVAGINAPEEAAEEVYRTLQPGGIAVMTTFPVSPHTSALDRTLEQVYKMPVQPHIKPEWEREERLRDLMLGAGLEDVKLDRTEVIMRHESLDRWTTLAWSWMGQPPDTGMWTEREERDWDKDRMLFGRECLKSGFEVDENGKVSVRYMACIAVGRKR